MNTRLKIKIFEKSGGRQCDFAKKIGMREARLSRIIHERETPTEDEKKAICKGLRVKRGEVFDA